MNPARTRIGRIKFKSGGEVRVLPDPEDMGRRYIERDFRAVLDAHAGTSIAGYAFVVWSNDGTSTCSAGINEGNQIPTILIPDFVRNRLLADRIERWTLETVNGVN